MKFVIDEDVPLKLLRTLRKLGHDAVRAELSTPDIEIAERAKLEGRVLVTVDSDFMNRDIFPPKEYNIIRIQIHPPDADVLIKAISELLKMRSEKEMRGLILLRKEGHFQFLE